MGGCRIILDHISRFLEKTKANNTVFKNAICYKYIYKRNYLPKIYVVQFICNANVESGARETGFGIRNMKKKTYRESFINEYHYLKIKIFALLKHWNLQLNWKNNTTTPRKKFC